MESFSCTESNGGPIVDLVWAGLNLVGALAVGANPEDYLNEDQTLFLGLSWAAFSTAAGAVGVGKTKKCRAAKASLAQRQASGGVQTPQFADTVVQAVVVSPTVDTLIVGERLQLVATAHNSGGVAIQGKTFVWASSNDAIASVSRAGLVTVHATGDVVIAANAQGIVGTARIVIVSPNDGTIPPARTP